jgi:hypothetical protein
MSKVSEALVEVWQWKEKIYEERKELTLADWAKKSKQNSRRLCKKYGIVKTTEPVQPKKALGA